MRPSPNGAAGRIRALLIIAGALGALLFLVPHMPTYHVRVIDTVLIYVLLGVGLNMVVGYAGLLDLGYVAFYAIGAYSYAILASDQFDIHLPFELILVIGGCLAGLAGVLLGIPVLRLRGDYLAMVTLGFGEIIRLLLNNQVWLTNGPQGIARIDEPFLLGFGLNTPKDFFWLLLPLVVVALTLAWRLEQSILGLGWAAIREDQDAARGIGIDTTVAKLLAFGLSATLGGFAGRSIRRIPALRRSRELQLLGVADHRADHRDRRAGQSGRRRRRGDGIDRRTRIASWLFRVSDAALWLRPGRDDPDQSAWPNRAALQSGLADGSARLAMTLSLKSVTKRFGALIANDSLSLRVPAGRITSVIGPNGAGKSTLINLCAGSYRVSSGRILLDQLELQLAKKHEIARAGVARTYQNIRLFDGMTVLQNLEVCLYPELVGQTFAEVFRPDCHVG